jgi:hypothetical protein
MFSEKNQYGYKNAKLKAAAKFDDGDKKMLLQ